jgi:hypothetical protein
MHPKGIEQVTGGEEEEEDKGKGKDGTDILWEVLFTPVIDNVLSWT